ncbi:endoribonuclease CG2145-like isoform X2 [Euwallacea fornicatus]|uniref:endoribonuclease CG2145-like isoform X2 n=1 Tax=Euwallacea fornicatus TaxID=995702 RepID=UPI00338D388D
MYAVSTFSLISRGDITNSGAGSPWKTNTYNSRNVEQKKSLLNTSTTTPWPSLGQRRRHNNNEPTTSTQSPKKWIQQNNIWIRNEQAASAPTGEKTEHGLNSHNLKNYTQDSKPQENNTPSLKGNVNKQQENSDKIELSDSTVTDDELRTFSETLLTKDSNNLMKYVNLNLQGITTSRSTQDEAPLPLLKIDDQAFQTSSVATLVLLYNNYFLEAEQNEVYTGQERIEENNFLDSMLVTPVMQHTRNFLNQKGKIGKDPKEFRDLLRQIWFFMYSRGKGRIGSSGFEHVFLAEIKNNQVSGLHNWVYFNAEESRGKANYLGYMKKIDLGEKGVILKYHFTFHDIDKPVGSMFIGTSPELEMGLYTICFVLRADQICPLKMNGNRFIIRTYSFRYRGKNMIGSAFPEI